MSTMLPVGKLGDVSLAAYHAADAISSTKLKVFAERPLLFKKQFIDRTVKPPSSPALDFGGALHHLLDGEDAFKKHCVLNTQFKDYRTNESKRWWDEQVAAGKIVVEKHELATMLQMREGVMRNPTARALIEGAESEVTWRTRAGEFVLQARTDKWQPTGAMLPDGTLTGPIAADFKSVDSLAPGAFQKAIAKFNYDWSSEFYRELIGMVNGTIPRFAWIAVEKNEPFDAEVFELDEESQLVARSGVILALKRLRKSYETGLFTGRPTGITPIGLPYWRVKEAEQELIESRRALE